MSRWNREIRIIPIIITNRWQIILTSWTQPLSTPGLNRFPLAKRMLQRNVMIEMYNDVLHDHIIYVHPSEWPNCSMVRMSYWRSQGCGVVHYVVCHLSPCSSMVRMSYWRSQGCGVVHYVVCHLSPCSSMVRTSHCHQKVMGYTLCSLPSAIWVLAAQWLATLMVFISVFLFRDRNSNIFAFTFYQENKPETNS